jgi:hypothetical protein
MMGLVDWVDDVLPGLPMIGIIVCYIHILVSLQWQRKTITPTAPTIEHLSKQVDIEPQGFEQKPWPWWQHV